MVRATALWLALVVALAACGNQEPICGPRLTCEDLARRPQWMAGSMEVVPEGFPPAPEGAELCGQAEGHTVFWLMDQTVTVHEHYRAALTATGWTAVGPVSAVDSPDGGVTCQTEQAFTMGNPQVLVRVSPAGGAFSLSLLNLEN